MKVALQFLFALLILLIMVIVVGLFLPDSQKISSTKEINVPAKIVFTQVNDFKRWNSWAPWMLKDKNIEISPGNTSIGKGAEIAWKSDVFGNCKATITQSIANESIAVDFINGAKGKSTSLWDFETVDDGTVVNWTMNISDLSLWERYFVLFNKDKMKLLIDKGIQELDSISRTLENSRISDIQIVELAEQPSIIMVDSVKPEYVIVRKASMIKEIRSYFENRKIKITGNPFCINYWQVNDTLIKIACGLPVSEPTWVSKTFRYYLLPLTKAIEVSHFGFPADKAHLAIEKYIKANKLETSGQPWEVYYYEPENNSDTASWETRVYYPLK